MLQFSHIVNVGRPCNRKDRSKVMQSPTRRIAAHNPLHWLLLLKWFITAPQQLKQYIIGLTAEGQRDLRQATTWTVTSLCFLPLLILSGYAGMQASLMAKLADYAATHRDSATLWVSQHWFVVPAALAACWISAILFDFRASRRIVSLLAVAASALGTLAAALLSGWLLGTLVLGLSVAPTCGLAIGLAQRVGSKQLSELTIRMGAGLMLGVIAAFFLGIASDPLTLGFLSVIVFSLQILGVYKLLDRQYKQS